MTFLPESPLWLIIADVIFLGIVVYSFNREHRKLAKEYNEGKLDSPRKDYPCL